MYLEHFGFSRAPFQMAPDGECLYLSQQHAKVMVYMAHSAWQPEGFVVITGEIGSGKTSLIKRMMSKYKNEIRYFHLPFTNLEGKELLHYLVMQTGVDLPSNDKASMLYVLTAYLREVSATGVPCVLVIDEAQNLSAENLEDIRMLAGLEGGKGPMLRVIIVGQPEFVAKINQSEQLKQRVKLHFHLAGLPESEMAEYISFRLRMGGHLRNDLFDKALVKKIYEFSHGIPRLINKVCDGLLMCAFADGRKKPDSRDFDGIVDDLMLSSPPAATDAEAAMIKATVEKVNGVAASAGVATGIDSEMMNRLVMALEGIALNLDVIAKNSGSQAKTK